MLKAFLGSLLLSIMLSGCQKYFLKNNEKSAAVVNNTKISLAKLDDTHERAIKILKKNNRAMNEDISKQVRASLLKRMIDDEIIKQEAKKQNLEVNRFERIAELRNFKKNLGGAKAFSLYVKNNELTKEQVIDTIVTKKLRKLLTEKVAAFQEPSKEDLLKHYEENKKHFMLPEMVRVSHILLKLLPNEPKEKAKLVFEKAQNILKEVQSGKESFDVLVTKYSEGPSIEAKGDLGFLPRGKMAKSFEEAAFGYPVGTIVGPIHTDFGFHIIKITDKKNERIAEFSEVQEKIIEQYKKNQIDKQAEKLLLSLRKEFPVTIHDSSLTWENFISEKISFVAGI